MKPEAAKWSISNRKLSPPDALAAQVRREGICAQVAASGASSLVLVRGPAGSGKTTVLVQCRSDLETRGVRTSWLTLGAADNDLSRFLRVLSLALCAIAPLDAGPAETPEALLQQVDSLSTSGPFALILDDLETVRDAVVLSLVRELIDRLPRQGQVLIGCRVMPDLGLARTRARGQLSEINPEDLRFTLQETQAFFARRGTVRLSTEDIERLHERTEGWVAGLWLASLAIDRHPMPAEFVQRFSGSTGVVADYLAEDVLNAQRPEVRRFLLRSSVLHRLEPGVCDAVLAEDGGAGALACIAKGELFLMSADDGKSYRYHSVFSAFLKGQLVREMPAEIPQLHGAASRWYEQQQDQVRAIEHALEGGLHQRAILLLESHVEPLLQAGRMKLLARWFGTLPPTEIHARPVLSMACVWSVCFTRGPWEAMRVLDHSGWTADDTAARPHVLALRPLLLGMMDRYQEAFDVGRDSLRALPTGHAFADGALAAAMAHTLLIVGHFRESHRLLERARQAQDRAAGGLFNRMFTETVEGILDLEAGQLRKATARFRLAVNANSSANFNATGGNAYAGVQYAGVLFEVGDFTQAERLLNVYLPIVRNVGLRDQLISGHMMLARIAFERGQLDRAWELLVALEQLGHERHLPRLSASARLQRAHLLGLQGDGQAARSELELASRSAIWERVATLRFPAHDIEDLQMGWLRWHLAFGDPAQAHDSILGAEQQALNDMKARRALKLRLLRSMALHRLQRVPEALKLFSAVLSQTASQGFVRLLVDEGAVVAELARLLDAQNDLHRDAVDPIDQEHLERILRITRAATQAADRAADRAADGATPSVELEKLTPKEVRMLRLLADGYSNSELAQKLFVSDSTVRTHLRNINQKLNASNRTQAVAIARKLGVVS